MAVIGREAARAPLTSADINDGIVGAADLQSTLDLSSKTITLPSISSLDVTGDLTVDTNTLYVDSTNNRVGVLRTNPSEALDVQGNILILNTGNPTMTVKASGAGNNPSYLLAADTNSWDITGVFSEANDPIRFAYNGSEAMRITSAGNVSVTGTLNGISTTKSASGNRWGILPEVESNGVMEIGRYLDFHATDGDTSDYGARLDFDGTNLICTAPIRASGGVVFGSTGGAVTSKTLDDYEEGTHTTTITPLSGGSITISSTYNTMHYTKIGRVVICTGYFVVSSVSSPSGVLDITLPFAAKNVVNNSSSVYAAFNGMGGGSLSEIWGIIDTNSSSAKFYYGAGASVSSTVANNVVATTDIRFQATYIVD